MVLTSEAPPHFVDTIGCSRRPECQEKPVKGLKEIDVTMGASLNGRAEFLPERFEPGGPDMGRPADKIPDEAGKLQRRILWCRRLAVGAADRKFSEILEHLARKIESEAVELEMSSGAPSSGSIELMRRG